MTSNKMKEHLNDVFELEEHEDETFKELIEFEKSSQLITDKIHREEESELDEDHQYARKNLKEIIKNSQETLKTLTVLARDTESARVYEVLAQITNATIAANEKLMSLQKTLVDIKGSSKGGAKEFSSDENNIAFSGSTTDLLKLREIQREQEREK